MKGGCLSEHLLPEWTKEFPESPFHCFKPAPKSHFSTRPFGTSLSREEGKGGGVWITS